MALVHWRTKNLTWESKANELIKSVGRCPIHCNWKFDSPQHNIKPITYTCPWMCKSCYNRPWNGKSEFFNHFVTCNGKRTPSIYCCSFCPWIRPINRLSEGQENKGCILGKTRVYGVLVNKMEKISESNYLKSEKRKETLNEIIKEISVLKDKVVRLENINKKMFKILCDANLPPLLT